MRKLQNILSALFTASLIALFGYDASGQMARKPSPTREPRRDVEKAGFKKELGAKGRVASGFRRNCADLSSRNALCSAARDVRY